MQAAVGTGIKMAAEKGETSLSLVRETCLRRRTAHGFAVRQSDERRDSATVSLGRSLSRLPVLYVFLSLGPPSFYFPRRRQG